MVSLDGSTDVRSIFREKPFHFHARAHLPLNPGCYIDVFTYNDRAIQAFKIEHDGFNVFVFFDA